MARLLVKQELIYYPPATSPKEAEVVRFMAISIKQQLDIQSRFSAAYCAKHRMFLYPVMENSIGYTSLQIEEL